ncbi:hypothetical protein CgunFtcFv8_000126 [Champsocephalus gunnari]|uniref:Uncharacterized protein n=1 Tax=Champsocephalus gunnari TaxID=52237 RepID=A0AAN8DH64_CHAGU|nr:hypothetical protein CgunFtcFv8_000126 [Champsocephalus gunnari]
MGFSQNPTVEQNVRPPSGKCQYVLASRLNSEAAQHPAVNQRASLCSALTKMYPSSKQPHPKTKTNSGVPARGAGPQPDAGSTWRSCQHRRFQIKPGGKDRGVQRKDAFL